MGFRRAAKVDGNQAQIVRELRALGYKVDLTHQLKKLYDLVVTGRVLGTDDVRTLRVEVKMPGERLTPDEAEYHRNDPYPQTLLIAYCTEDITEWYSTGFSTTKKNSDYNVDTSANVVVENLDTICTTSLSTTSKKKAKRSTKSLMTKET